MKNPIITINARKYGGKVHRTWEAELVERQNSLLVLVGKFDRDVKHPDLGLIKRGTVSREYYWLDRWYNVFRFHEPNGDFRNFYCNISLPPTFENGVLDYIDLEIDLLVNADFSCEVLDLDEYETLKSTNELPESTNGIVKRTVEQLKDMITLRRFPFDTTARP